MVQRAVNQLSQQVTQALLTAAITGNKPELDFDDLLQNAVKTGVLAGINAKLDMQLGFADPKAMNLSDKLAQASVHAVTQTGVMGGNFADNLRNSLVDVAGKNLAGYIGDNKELWGDLSHKAAHAALGCAIVAAKQGDCGAGAIGAVAGEITAELTGLQTANATPEQQQRIVLLTSQLSSITAAALAGQEDLAGAMGAATNAVTNNFLTHTQQAELAKQLNACAGTPNPEQCRQDVFASWKDESEANNQKLSDLYEACDTDKTGCAELIAFMNEGLSEGDKAVYSQIYQQTLDNNKDKPFKGKVPTYEQFLAGLLLIRPIQAETINAHQAAGTWLGDTYVSRQSYDDNPFYRQLDRVKQTAEVLGWLGEAAAVLGPSRYGTGTAAEKLTQLGSAETTTKITQKEAERLGYKPCCFVAGTPVATPHGYTPIEQLKVGDQVLTRLEEAAAHDVVFAAAVTATHQRTDQAIYTLVLSKTTPTGIQNETLHVTAGHPFFVPKANGFIPLKDLQVGDELTSQSGEPLHVQRIELEQVQGLTYNLTVEQGHTFFVGRLRTWVHNTGPCVECQAGNCAVHSGSGSPAHKAERWKEYQDRDGEWTYERWSNVYEANMVRANKANKIADEYQQQLGWGTREYTVKNVGDSGLSRRSDIADAQAQKGVEVKSGYITQNDEIRSEIERDIMLVNDGWKIEWHFDGLASRPLLDTLDKAGIPWSFRDPTLIPKKK